MWVSCPIAPYSPLKAVKNTANPATSTQSGIRKDVRAAAYWRFGHERIVGPAGPLKNQVKTVM